MELELIIYLATFAVFTVLSITMIILIAKFYAKLKLVERIEFESVIVEQDDEVKAEEPAIEVKAEEPVIEKAPEVKEEIKEETAATETEEVETEDDDTLKIANGRNLTFMEKLDEADDKIKEYYANVDNEFKTYRKVHARVSNSCVSYRLGRELIAKMTIHGKTLKLFLALGINYFEASKYFQKDSSDKKAYQEVPFTVKIKSDRAEKRAIELVTALCEKNQIAKKRVL